MALPVRPSSVALLLLLGLACDAGSQQAPKPDVKAADPSPAPDSVPEPAVVDPGRDPLLLATLYNQGAAEYAAATRAQYQAAEAQLAALVEDGNHTAVLEQGEDFAAKPPAVVLDVDETVLDNSPYQARVIEDGLSFPVGWDEWCQQSEAGAIPGALAFTRFAAEQGVHVFYVTNRDAALEDATRKNLLAAGFPVADDYDAVLMANEREDWSSDKTSRRRHLAQSYRIVMLFGDNLGDFVGKDAAKAEPKARAAVVDEYGERWGHSWFMLPNPMYGYWEGALIDYNYGLDAAAIGERRLSALDPKH